MAADYLSGAYVFTPCMQKVVPDRRYMQI